MTKKTLPSIAEFEDKRITTGLKFIIGGASYTKTSGGWMNDGGGGKIDYVADATYGTETSRGFCSHHENADSWYSSDNFRAWCKRVGADY